MKKLILGLAMAFAANVFAEPQPLGDTSTTWELTDGNTVLVIGGTGKMPDWEDWESSVRPWHDVRNVIESVVVGEGVTSVGANAFKWFGSLTNATLASTVASVGASAFSGCESFTRVAIPANVTSVGAYAFFGCKSLAGVTMKGTTPPELGTYVFGSQFDGAVYVPAGSKSAYERGTGWDRYKSNLVEAYVVALAPTAHGTVAVDKDAFPIDGFPDGETVTVTATPDEGFYLKSLVWNDGEDHDITKAKQFTMPSKGVTVSAAFEKILMTREEAEQVYWEAETAVSVVKTSLKLGGRAVSEADYAEACELYGLAAKPKPTAEGFKAVDKDAQIVGEGEIAVKRAELQAAGAETVSVDGGAVTLGVTVKSNGDLSAGTKDWRTVELKSENVKVENGKIIVTFPVDSPSGFMILQSGDAKIVPSDGNGTPKLPQAEIKECD